MSEHFCKHCKNGKGDACNYTGTTHITGIECPSFEAKEKEVEMSFRVRKTDDFDDVWTVADGGNCDTTNKYIAEDGTVGHCEIYDTEYEAQAALDLYLEKQRPVESEPTFVDHPEGVLEVKGISSGAKMESYKSGATRTPCETKIDPEGFFSPLVMLRYSIYMHKCRVQADGTLRDSDNWQGGIPIWRYMKGKWRHFLDTWLMHRGYKKMTDEGLDLQECLCAEMFNTMGYLHEMLCAEKGIKKDRNVPVPGGAHANFKDCMAPVEKEY